MAVEGPEGQKSVMDAEKSRAMWSEKREKEMIFEVEF